MLGGRTESRSGELTPGRAPLQRQTPSRGLSRGYRHDPTRPQLPLETITVGEGGREAIDTSAHDAPRSR
jgi:hypothetical protein